ncbi:MAG: hypothetical protein ACTHJW_09630 [Streptosporangiaceae bacterium]
MSSKTARSVGACRYDSIMCSTPEQRLAEIGHAIDDLAAQADPDSAGAAGSPVNGIQNRDQASEDADQVMKRLAELWAKLAQLDPEVAKRLPTYEA